MLHKCAGESVLHEGPASRQWVWLLTGGLLTDLRHCNKVLVVFARCATVAASSGSHMKTDRCSRVCVGPQPTEPENTWQSHAALSGDVRPATEEPDEVSGQTMATLSHSILSSDSVAGSKEASRGDSTQGSSLPCFSLLNPGAYHVQPQPVTIVATSEAVQLAVLDVSCYLAAVRKTLNMQQQKLALTQALSLPSGQRSSQQRTQLTGERVLCATRLCTSATSRHPVLLVLHASLGCAICVGTAV